MGLRIFSLQYLIRIHHSGPHFGGKAFATRRRTERQKRENIGRAEEVSHRLEEATGLGKGEDGQTYVAGSHERAQMEGTRREGGAEWDLARV